LVVGALVVLGARLGRLAGTPVAGRVGAALVVGRARLALAGLAHLAGRTLLVVLALRREDACVGHARLAAGTVAILDALDALAPGAVLSLLAVLVGLAGRRLRRVTAARRDGAHAQGEPGRQDGSTTSRVRTIHGLEAKFLRHVSQIRGMLGSCAMARS